MSKIKYYIHNVRRNGKEAGEDLLKPSTTLFYQFTLTEGTSEEKTGWRSYETFTDDEFEYRSAFWDAVQYWYEDNDSIKFIIDKERNDSFFHYFEYIDDVPVYEGWGQYTKLHTDKERKAWKKGQKDFMDSMGVNTPLFQMRTYIADIKNHFQIEEDKWPEEKSLLIPSFPTLLAGIIKDLATNNLSDDFIDKILELMHAPMPTMHNALLYAFNAACYNINLKYTKLLNGIKELGVSAFLNPVLSQVLKMAEEYLETADLLYNELTRYCNKPIRIYRRVVEASKDDDDDRVKRLTKEFKEATEKFNPEIKEFLYEILFIDVLVELMKQLKNIETSTIRSWRNVIAGAKTLRDMDVSDVKSKAVTALQNALKILLPLLGALIGALYGMKCAKEEDRKVDLVGRKRLLDNAKEKDRSESYTGIEEYLIGEGTEDEDIDADKLEAELHEEMNAIEAKEELTLFDVAIVYVKAFYDLDCFSLIGPNVNTNGSGQSSSSSNNISKSTSEMKPEDCFPCKMSMCETSDDTDLDTLVSFPPMGAGCTPRKVAVEIGQDLFPVSSLCVEVNQHIHIDDIIGYIDGVPIKSIVDCSVEIVEPSYFVAWYYFEDDTQDLYKTEDDYENYVNDYYNEHYDKFKDKVELYQELMDFYKMSAYTDLFIKDYISFFRFPELALFTRDYSYNLSFHSTVLVDMFKTNFGISSGYRVANGTEVSSDKFIEKYEDEAWKIIDNYNKTIKDKAGKKKVKQYVAEGNTVQLKNVLDEEKKKFTNNILKLYFDNPGKMKYCSKGRIVDFMLCDNWIEYLHNDEFFYDDDNPYVKELSDAISDFIAIRERLELNKNNIEHLISKFNQYCDPVLKKYSFGYTTKYTYVNNYNRNFDYNTTFDYYSRFKELFKFEYYLDTDSIEEGTEGEENTIGLFRRVYKYLKTLVGLNTSEPAGIEINEDTDVAALLDTYDKMDSAPDEENAKLDRKLRQIAHRYISLVRIENGMTQSKIAGDGKQYQYIANEYQRIDCEMARDYDGRGTFDIIKEIYFEMHERVLSQYLRNLKTITTNELDRLKKITEKAVTWYNKNSEQIYNNAWFEKFKEVPWDDPMEIYHECIKTDYYLFTDIFTHEYFSPAFADYDGTGEGPAAYEESKPIPGEATTPVKVNTLDDLDKLEKKILEDKKKEEKDPDLTTGVHPKSKGDITTMKYWLKYCLMATLVNAMVPIYWGTGLIISGVPIPLPIIYIPLVVIRGRTICVIGLGLCGICPLPMILFVNPTGTKSTIILPLNIAVDMLIKAIGKLGQLNFAAIQKLIVPLIKKLDGEIQGIEDQIADLEYQINEVKTTIIHTPKTEYLMKHELDLYEGKDTTTHCKDDYMISTEYAQETLYIPNKYPEYDRTQLPVAKYPQVVYYPTTESAENAGAEVYDDEIYTLSDRAYEFTDDRKKDYCDIIVFLDPGHDYNSTHKNDKPSKKASPKALYGVDGGPAIEEWDYNRRIAEKVESLLKQYARNITVMYSIPSVWAHGTPSTTNRKRRACDIMRLPENKNKHAVYLSIHLNAAGSGKTWYTSKKGGWSVYVSSDNECQRKGSPLADSLYKLAYELSGGYTRKNGKTNWWTALSTGRTDLTDLWELSPIGDPMWPKIPAALTENFFMDYTSDAYIITSNIDTIAKINALGIIDFLDNKTKWVRNHEILIT